MLVDPENPPSRQATERAADGLPIAPAANSFSDFIRFQEDGHLNDELTAELRKLASEMMANAIDAGGKSKGKLTLTFNFALEGRVFAIASKYKIDLPDAPRPKSVMWATEDGRFTPQNPQQGHLFGMREVRSPGGIRDA